MSWFKVDDKLHSHPKWIALPKGAQALWTTAGSWASDQLTDGHIPTSALRSLRGTAREADQLVTAGLWETTDTGWVFHDWHARNPRREQVVERRAKSAERIRQWREQRRPDEGDKSSHVRAV